MAEKGFGVKEVNLIGASGTPTITSPNNINMNAVNVAISTNVSIGGTLSVTGNVSVGGTLTYEDVTNIDSIGVITARSGVDVDDFISVGSNIHLGNAGVVTATSFDGSLATTDLTGTITNAQLAGSIAGTKISPDFGSQNIVTTGNLSVARVNPTAPVTLPDSVELRLGTGEDLELVHNGSNSIINNKTATGSIKIQTNGSDSIVINTDGHIDLKTNVDISKDLDVDGHTNLDNVSIAGVVTATTFSGSGASLTSIPAGQLTGTVADARISTLTASKLSGALPAISGANLTNLDATSLSGPLPAISGANLTNLDASDLASGTIPDARFPATLPAASGANLTSLPAANLTGTLPAINGSNLTNLSAGKVLQVVNVEVANTSITTNNSSFTTMNTSVVITPSAASSKIFILMTGGGTYVPHSQAFAYVTVYRGSDNIGDSSTGLEGFYNTGTSYAIVPHSLSVLDTPTYNLGDAITYTIYARSTGGVYQFQNTDRSHITLTAMEVAA